MRAFPWILAFISTFFIGFCLMIGLYGAIGAWSFLVGAVAELIWALGFAFPLAERASH